MLPKFIYDALPYLVAITGASAALIVYNRFAVVSGFVLIVLALVIVHMRLDSRTRRVSQLEGELLRLRAGRARAR
ncbi:MAG: hypothetical protein EXR39_01845 [Betaproteobacteria bacterium]|nr:hypothetical protein [Betaproteobacteria bacterium]